ncbi:MAG: LuxR C-terminal-related transcriptional regulator [Chloroflexota bacterium]|jgi:DNA-binding NarL/FixJ family response regulator
MNMSSAAGISDSLAKPNDVEKDPMKWVFTPNIRLDERSEENIDLFESKELLLNILNSIQDGVSVLDRDLRIRYVNTSMRHWYSNDSDILGKKCFKIYHNRPDPCDNCPILKAIDIKSPVIGIVKYSILGSDKGWQELFAIPILDLQDNVLGVLEYVRDITFQYKMENELSDILQRFETLEKKNEAISQLLSQRRQEREQLEQTIVQNLEKYIRPSLEVLKSKTESQDVELIEGLIEEIVYPITRKRSSSLDQLSSRELQISTFVKEGKSSKEIADLLCISTKTVAFHRAKIRKKLGLNDDDGNKLNLRSYLNTHL